MGKSITSDLEQFYNFVAAMEFCNLRHISSMSRKMLAYVQYVYESIAAKRFKCSSSLKGRDVAGHAHKVLKDVCTSVAMCHRVQCLRAKREQRVRAEANREGDVEDHTDQDPDWSTEETDTSEVEEVVSLVEEEEEQSEEEEEGESDRDAKTQSSRKGKEPMTIGSKSSRPRRQCLVPGCKGFAVVNLKRHLTKVHCSKGEISKDDVERLFVLSSAGSSKTGPMRNYCRKQGGPRVQRRMRWCPVQGCSFLGAYLPQHLTQVHKMDNRGERYKNSLQMARHYQGSDEEIESWRPPVASPLQSKPATVVTPRKRNFLEIYSDSSSTHSSHGPPKKRREAESVDSSEVVPPSPPRATTPSVAPVSGAEDDSEESDSASEWGYDNNEAFFTESNPRTPRHRWLVAFYEHLITPAAGFHQEKNRLQHAAQVKTLLEYMEPSGSNIEVLCQDDGSKLWLGWVLPNLKNKAPGTLKSYLNSLEMFLEFVTTKTNKRDLPALSSEDRGILADLCRSLKGWRRTITKETASVRNARYLSETERLLTTREVSAIMESEPAEDGQNALEAARRATTSQDLSVSQYAAARDLLLVSLTRYTGTRPGALESVSLGQYRRAKWDSKKRFKVMLVSSHKREVDGPAPIPLHRELVDDLEVFLTKLRPVVSQDRSDEGKIFLKSDGAPYHKGTIGRRITAFILKSGVRADRPISATDFRKWLVTTMKEQKRIGTPVDEDLLRRLMCHSDKTAQTWYLREDLTEVAAEASQQIRQHTTATSKEKETHPASTEEETKSAPTESLPTSTSVAASSTKALTPEETSAVSVVFRDDIRARISPRKKRVVSLMGHDETLKKIVHSQDKDKRVVDRVRYLVRSQQPDGPGNLPEDDPQARTNSYVMSHPPTETSSAALFSSASGRQAWTEEETDLIRTAVAHLDKVPTNNQIRSIFCSSIRLEAILQSNPFERVRNKVHNIFKQRR